MSSLFFKYQAFDQAGRVENGQLNAESEREAVRILKGRNLTPVKIHQTRPGTELLRRKKISNADLLDFTSGLCTLVEARVPLDKALRLLDGITESATMRELVLQLLKDVKEGAVWLRPWSPIRRYSARCTSTSCAPARRRHSA